MTLVHSIIISILQGISELFPVSSLGHAVLLPKLLHWGINEKSATWLAFLVALHVGTAVALLIYFRDLWVDVVRAFVRSIQRGQLAEDHDQRLAWMVVLGTVPAGIVGFVLEHPLRGLFGSPKFAACFLIINGLIMLVGEWFLKRQAQERMLAAEGSASSRRVARGGTIAVDGDEAVSNVSIGRYRDITELSWRDAAIVGLAQVGALFPGISRSGITMVAGLGAGLTHEASARYTFLLATPIIGAAALIELPKLFEANARSVLGYAIIGSILAGMAAYVAVRFLMRYFETGRLLPFAYYSIAAGALSLLLLSIS